MEFPKPILLIAFDVAEDQIDLGLEGSMVWPVEAFDTDALTGFRFETVIVCWSSLYSIPDRREEADDVELRKRLIDWINLEVSPRIRSSRRPVWL